MVSHRAAAPGSGVGKFARPNRVGRIYGNATYPPITTLQHQPAPCTPKLAGTEHHGNHKGHAFHFPARTCRCIYFQLFSFHAPVSMSHYLTPLQGTSRSGAGAKTNLE